jgi:hypothetical protein
MDTTTNTNGADGAGLDPDALAHRSNRKRELRRELRRGEGGGLVAAIAEAGGQDFHICDYCIN